MRVANRIITLVLAVAAALVWAIALDNRLLQALGTWPTESSSVHLCAITLSAAACFGWLLIFLTDRQRDALTRCRACGHILRGLSEPRCPECGERI